MYLSNMTLKEKISIDEQDSGQLIIKIDDMIKKINDLKNILTDKLKDHELGKITNFLSLYQKFIMRVEDVVSYLNDVISAMNKLDPNYKNKYNGFDRLDRWFDAEDSSSCVLVLKNKRAEIEDYLKIDQYDHFKTIDDLLQKFKELKDDILTGRKGNISCISDLEFKFAVLNSDINFEIRSIIDIDEEKNEIVKMMNDFVDCIGDLEKDESLTSLKDEYRRRLTTVEEKSGLDSSVNIDEKVSKLSVPPNRFLNSLMISTAQEMVMHVLKSALTSLKDEYRRRLTPVEEKSGLDSSVNIDEKVSKLSVPPSRFPNSLMICKSQERVIHVLKSALHEKYSSIDDIIEPLKNVSVSLHDCNSIVGCINEYAASLEV